MDYNTLTVLIAHRQQQDALFQMTAEEQQEFRIPMQRRQDEEKIRYKHIKESGRNRTLRRRSPWGGDEYWIRRTNWGRATGTKTIESRMNWPISSAKDTN